MKKIKLNLGAGFDHRQGWINTDIDSRTNPDKIVDLSKSLPFKNAYADQVLLQDVLEHFTKEDGERLLVEIHRTMKMQGMLEIRIPNVFQIVSQFGGDPEVMMEFLYGTTSQNGIWGAHKAGYTSDMIRKILKRIGFGAISISKMTTNFVITCKKNIEKQKSASVLIIQQAPDWGGAEEWMYTLAKHIRSKEIKIHTATNFPILSKKYKRIGASTTHIPFTLDIIGNTRGLIKSAILLPYALYWYIRKLMNYKREGVEVILMSGFSEKLLVSWIAYFFKIPVVWYEYGPLELVFSRNMYLPKILYRLTKHLPRSVITISENTKQALISQARISLSKLEMIFPGVSIPSKPNPTQGDLVVGHISRLTPEKGQRILLTAWKEVVRSIPKAKLRIAGKGPDLAYLKKLAEKLHITSSVEFLGFIDDKKSFFSSLSMFVFPSVWEMEGFGIVSIEALSYGLPVAIIDNGPAREIINNTCGQVSQSDPHSLAKTIIQLLKSKTYKKKSMHAFDRAKNLFNQDVQAEKIRKILQNTAYENR